MAERLKDQLLEEEKLVDLVVGPDAYRDLPRLVDEVEGGRRRSIPCSAERRPTPRSSLSASTTRG